MDAPEKIYLTPLECMAASCQPQKDNTVEYTRTDAFIKKAINYLDYKLSDIVKVRQAGTIIEAAMIKPEFIEDFKKAMKL